MIREIAGGYPQVEAMDTWTWFQSGLDTHGAHNPVRRPPLGSGPYPPRRQMPRHRQELNEIYRRHDLRQIRSFGYGHSFGVLSHYYGREAGVEPREDVETGLRPNMVVSMEPMIMVPEDTAGWAATANITFW